MDGECFACVGPASEQYILVLESGKVLEDKWVCDGCLIDFRDEEWIEMHEAPVLMRGGNGNNQEADESEDSD